MAEIDLARLLSEGLDLCVRAKKLDADINAMTNVIDGGTRCGTPALWHLDHYDHDLADWEARARKALLESGLAERVRAKQ